MKQSPLAATLVLFWLAMAALAAPATKPAAPPASRPALTYAVTTDNATVVALAESFAFTEGPAADAEGNVFFTDQPNNRIHKYSIDGKLSTFLEPAGRSNGTCFDATGNLITCADEKNELWSIDKDGNEGQRRLIRIPRHNQEHAAFAAWYDKLSMT